MSQNGPKTTRVHPSQAVGLYIHVPFCSKICPYCDFAVIPDNERLQKVWLETLLAELHIRKSEYLEGSEGAFDSIYIGGGTPSVLHKDLWQQLLSELNSLRKHPDDELSTEANPESLTEELIALWKSGGVNRISIGTQSLNPKFLQVLGRDHSRDRSLEAMASLKASGITWNADLMFCYPGQTVQDFLQDLEELIELDPHHISFYGLTVEERTLFSQWEQKGKFFVPNNYDEFYENGSTFLKSRNYMRYEVSNFCRIEGDDFDWSPNESFHNKIYWNSGSWLGVGPGAHSFLSRKVLRTANPDKFNSWRAWVDAGCDQLQQSSESLTPEQQAQERIWLGLRTATGLDLSIFFGKFDQSWLDWTEVDRYKSLNYLIQEEDKLILEGKGWLFLDEIAVDLLKLPKNLK